MNKYEQLVEFIINDETDKARELFHNIVVEKSRDIYESLIDESDLEETMGGNQVEDLVDEVACDEEGISEEEDDMDVMDMDSEDDSEMDFDASGDLDSHEEEHGDVEDRVEDLESALDELKAEFDALMAGEEAEEEQFPGIHGDDNGEEVDMNMMEAEEDEDEDEEELDETIVREYVEKVSAPSNTEGADNKTSIVAKKNDMGGTAANIVKGGTENGAGKISPKGKLPHADQYENVPGAKAGNAFAKKQSAKTKEEGGVDKQSPLAK
jgi:chromosome segregation ATPase